MSQVNGLPEIVRQLSLTKDESKFDQQLKDLKSKLNKLEWLDLLVQLAVEPLLYNRYEKVAVLIEQLSEDEESLLYIITSAVTNYSGWNLSIALTLKSISQNNPDLKQELVSKMIESDNFDVQRHAAFLLEELASKEPNTFLEQANRRLRNITSGERVAYLRTINQAFGFAEQLPMQDAFFKLIDSLSSNLNGYVEQEAIDILFLLHRFDKEHCYQRISEKFQLGDLQVQARVAHNTMIHRVIEPDIPLLTSEDHIRFMNLISSTKHQRVLELLAHCLASSAKEHIVEKLLIVLELIVSERYFGIHLLDWAIGEIGKADLDLSLQTVIAWLDNNPSSVLIETAPYLLTDISRSNYELLLDSIQLWPFLDEPLSNISLKSLHIIVKESHEDSTLLPFIFDILVRKCDELDLDASRILGSEGRLRHQCGILIKKIQRPPLEVDYDLVQRTLSAYPNLNQFLGKRWFSKQKKTDLRYHPILQLIMLGHQEPLIKLEELILSIKSTDPTRRIKNGLRDDYEFWDTISELKLIYKFREAGFDVRLQQKLPGTDYPVDLLVIVHGQHVLIEVYNPHEFAELRNFGMATLNPLRLKYKILDKFQKQIEPLKQYIQDPFIFAVDIENSDMDIEDAIAVFYGKPTITSWIHKESREVIETKQTWAGDGMHIDNPQSKILSGILPFRNTLTTNLSWGKFLTNPHTIRMIGSKIVAAIESAF